jgi:hypothetical protein
MSATELAKLQALREGCESEEKLLAARSDRMSPIGDAGAPRASTRLVAPATTSSDPAGCSPKHSESLLRSIAEVLRRFVVLPSEEALVAVQLFVLHTWAIDAAYATPYLAIVSAEKQSGKTKLLEVLELLVRNPWLTASASESALFRTIEAECPTLLLDEVDAIFGSNTDRTEPLRALLNAGNKKRTTVSRCVPPKFEARKFSVFCPKILSGIDTGKLPETPPDTDARGARPPTRPKGCGGNGPRGDRSRGPPRPQALHAPLRRENRTAHIALPNGWPLDRLGV